MTRGSAPIGLLLSRPRRPIFLDVVLEEQFLSLSNLGSYPMSVGTILLIILILLLLGVLPTWPHSRGWGYYPSGGIGLLLLIVVILLLMGRI